MQSVREWTKKKISGVDDDEAHFVESHTRSFGKRSIGRDGGEGVVNPSTGFADLLPMLKVIVSGEKESRQKRGSPEEVQEILNDGAGGRGKPDVIEVEGKCGLGKTREEKKGWPGEGKEDRAGWRREQQGKSWRI